MSSDWQKGDPVTLKGWQIMPIKGKVVDIRPDGSLVIKTFGGGTIVKSPMDVFPKTDKAP
jgi:hypothetical protein